jgi:Malic enzyme, NAD binding domain
VPILTRYQDKVCTYNDDIQGTAAVALAGMLGALRISGQKLTEQRFLFLGGGSAATGIAELISQAMALEGMDIAAARSRNALFDIEGLIVRSRTDLAEFQKPFAQDHAPISVFADAVKALRPTGIIGVSTVPKLFNQQVIEAMAEINERPIIFPYSNPTSRSECTAEEAYRWSQGRAIFASGSPFPPVEVAGKTFVPGQGNNVYIFPAMGMAIFATEAKRVNSQCVDDDIAICLLDCYTIPDFGDGTHDQKKIVFIKIVELLDYVQNVVVRNCSRVRLYTRDDFLSGNADALYQSARTGFFEFFTRGVDGKLVAPSGSAAIFSDKSSKQMIEAGSQTVDHLSRENRISSVDFGSPECYNAY